MTRSKPTPGPAKTDPEYLHETVLGGDGKMIADCSIFARRKNENEVNRANAALIAEAFNVHHETGLTPQQLREMVKELSDTLLKLRPLGGSECFVSKGDGFYVADTRYFAQLIEQERVSTHEARKGKVRAEKQRDELLAALSALDRMNRGLDWCDPDEQARRWSCARAAIAKVEGRS